MLTLSNPTLFCILSLQMQQWFNVEGERHLMEAESVEDSGDRMEQILNSFTGFLIDANVSLCFFLFFFFCSCVFVFLHLSLSLRAGPEAPCHDVSVRGGATSTEWAFLPRVRGVRVSSLYLQVGPGGLSVQSGGVRQGAADHG